MVERGIQDGPRVARLLTAELRAAGLLPTGYRVVSRCVGCGPLCVLYLVCGDECGGVYVGFDYETARRSLETLGAEAVWLAHAQAPHAH